MKQRLLESLIVLVVGTGLYTLGSSFSRPIFSMPPRDFSSMPGSENGDDVVQCPGTHFDREGLIPC